MEINIDVEDYECDGCNNDGNTHMGCGDCPHNSERISEWKNKYQKNENTSYENNVAAIIKNKGGCGFISD